jgi:hypothetical protein
MKTTAAKLFRTATSLEHIKHPGASSMKTTKKESKSDLVLGVALFILTTKLLEELRVDLSSEKKSPSSRD